MNMKVMLPNEQRVKNPLSLIWESPVFCQLLIVAGKLVSVKVGRIFIVPSKILLFNKEFKKSTQIWMLIFFRNYEEAKEKQISYLNRWLLLVDGSI